MARADLLVTIVQAGVEGDQGRLLKAVEALITEERALQHRVLADRLEKCLNPSGRPVRRTIAPNDAAKFYHEVLPQRGFQNLLLPHLVQQVCTELVEEHNRCDLLRAHNLEPRNRVLLVGPPGNGKTSLAEALAYELGCPLLVARYEGILGSFMGESAGRLDKLFTQASAQRCVLFFDEFDTIGKERGDSQDIGEIKRVVGSLLLQVDRLPSHVVVVTATNHSELLDRAVWRRFQLRLDLPAPNLEQRIAWLRMFESRSAVTFDYAHEALALQLEGFSFAELEQFALDVQRRQVLAEPGLITREITAGRLSHRMAQAAPTPLPRKTLCDVSQ